MDKWEWYFGIGVGNGACVVITIGFASIHDNFKIDSKLFFFTL